MAWGVCVAFPKPVFHRVGGAWGASLALLGMAPLPPGGPLPLLLSSPFSPLALGGRPPGAPLPTWEHLSPPELVGVGEWRSVHQPAAWPQKLWTRSAPLPISHLRGLGSPSPPGLLAERWGVGTLEGHRERVAGLCPPPDRHATSSSVGSWAQVVALCCGSPPPPPGLSSPLLEGLPGVCLLPSPAPPSRCSQESPNPGKSRWA